MITKRTAAALALAAVTILAAGWMLWPKAAAIVDPTTAPDRKQTPAEIDLTHRRETWISALEWCESRGKNDALNPEDRDGTASYSNFQWKPSTLLLFGKKYKLIATSTTLSDVPDLLKEYDLQRNIVRNMIPDKTIDWYQQFPDCVKRKVGLPPIK